ncbi:MAG: hypothetical protein NC429_14385 [Lachnospiraceae bacterium]|nr:hypothetical protein [Lachnospiraceae bacterium]
MEERDLLMENAVAEKERKGGRKGLFLAVCVIGAAVLATVLCFVLLQEKDKGYENYTVQMKQHYVEYSEEYDYWDVLTVEYPEITGIDSEIQSQLNTLMYDTAMDRVNYWHLNPSDAVKAFQEEYFSIFCSDVNCKAAYHSQYLLSLDYLEFYSAGNPVWCTNGTERALTLDLVTGESYELADILEINKEFVRLWDKTLSDRLGEEYGDEEDIEIMLSWFMQSDEQINQDYFCRPFFYVTEEKDLVVGISLDPILEYAYTYEPTSGNFSAQLSGEELEPFKKESEFWNKYEKSQTAGEVLPCEDKKENLWLGEDAGIWDYEY